VVEVVGVEGWLGAEAGKLQADKAIAESRDSWVVDH
jgi:hypothetical protein